MSSIPLALQLGQFFSSLTFDDLPEDVVHCAKMFFLDWLGSAIAGRKEKPIRPLLLLADQMKAINPKSTIIPTGTKHFPLIAAFINGASSHVLEMDDLHRPSILHPAAPIMPAIFAAAEDRHASGKDLIVAIVTGYEVGIRTALAAGHSHYQYWHTTGTCGTFGAAAGAARLLRLQPENFAWALGSAGTQSSGLWEFLTDGAMSKQLHPGKAAMNGLLAAILARKGFSGAIHIFEGDKGFLKATSPNHDFEVLVRGLGNIYHMRDNSLKYYASCGHTHTAVECAIDIHKQIKNKIAQIDAVHVHIYQEALELLGNVELKTPYLAKFNIPFCVALALSRGHAGLDDFTHDSLHDPVILQILRKVFLHHDTQLTGLYPEKWPAKVVVKMQDGSQLDSYREFPKGEPQNPLNQDEIIGKFHTLCHGRIDTSSSEKIAERVLTLEQIIDVNEIFND